MITISVVVPVYSGEEYLESLVQELQHLRNLWIDQNAPLTLVETILVDDAALDNSPALIDQLSDIHSWVTAIHLARNFGQHPATIAGILHTAGDWVVTLDEDLQHPPARINDLLREVARTSCDVVYANAENSVHQSHVRDRGSRLYKRLISKLSGNPNIRHFNSFRLIRGSIARAASSVCGHDTYFDVALSWFTKRVAVVRMQLKDERFIRERKSGYKLSTLLSHARRMLMSSGVKMMRTAGAIGLLTMVLSMLLALVVTIQKLLFPETIIVGGWTSLIVTVLFFGGVVTFLLGVALEYLSVLIMGAHGKPIFFTIDRRRDVELARFFSASEP